LAHTVEHNIMAIRIVRIIIAVFKICAWFNKVRV